MKAETRGRPRKPGARLPGTRFSVSTRLSSDLWHRLDALARSSGRSISMEIEMRLAQSLRDDEVIARLDAVIGGIVRLGKKISDLNPEDPDV